MRVQHQPAKFGIFFQVKTGIGIVKMLERSENREHGMCVDDLFLVAGTQNATVSQGLHGNKTFFSFEVFP